MARNEHELGLRVEVVGLDQVREAGTMVSDLIEELRVDFDFLIERAERALTLVKELKTVVSGDDA